MRKQVEIWRRSELTDATAKLVIYEAFVEGRLKARRHLARTVHDLYFEPKYGVPVSHYLEPLQCFHVGVEGTGSRPVEGDSKGGIS